MMDDPETREQDSGVPENDDDMLIRVTLYPDRQAGRIQPVSELDEIIVEKQKLSGSLSRIMNQDLLPFFILSLLKKRSHFGTEIMAEIKEHGSLWSSSPGTIYPLLKKLEDRKLLTVHWEKGLKRDRHVYELTAHGVTELDSITGPAISKIEASISTLAGLLETVRNHQ